MKQQENRHDKNNSKSRRNDVVNDAVRKAFQVDKVSSSHSKGETVIISDGPLDEGTLKTAISATGYEVKGISSEPYEKKKGLFSFFHK